MENMRIAVSKTVQMLDASKLTFGSFSFSLWQMIFAFASLRLFIWFIITLFTKDED